jgi:hypothetical protein
MATNGPINKDSFNIRQQEIVFAAAKQLNISYDDINSALIRNDIPETISVSTEKGNFTTSLIPIYGEILNSREKAQIIDDRLQSAAAEEALGSLNGFSNSILGSNQKPEVSSAGTDRVRAETLANPTFDPSTARRTNAGLPAGEQNTRGSDGTTLVKFSVAKGEDTRVRIVVPQGPLQEILLRGAVLSPLAPTNGVLFPYTPNIIINHGARYDSQNLTHSNYAYHFYQSSDTESISINATFACKNSTDAAYVLAAQHFFRTVTKMFYGQDAEAGLPPPVLRLEGHGDYQFGSHKQNQPGGVPVIIESFSVTLPEDVDYISTGATLGGPETAGPGNLPTGLAPSASTLTRVPIVQQFSITCKPLYCRRSISQEFGFKRFAAGQLLGSPNRGGFI